VLDQLGIDANVLVSAGHRWGGLRFSKSVPRPRRTRLLFIDSGAQQFSRFRDYPYTTRAYFLACLRWRADLAATLDYPLDMIFRFRVRDGDAEILGHRPGFNHTPSYWIRRTVENAVDMLALWEAWGRPMKPLPVIAIQGLAVDHFLECLDQLLEHVGPKWPYWGIGSLCMSPSSLHIYNVVRAVRRRLPNSCIHVWGPDVRAIWSIALLIDSWDSSMWVPLRENRSGLTCCVPIRYRIWDPKRRRFIEVRGSYEPGRRFEYALMCAREWLRFLRDLETYVKVQRRLIDHDALPS